MVPYTQIHDPDGTPWSAIVNKQFSAIVESGVVKAVLLFSMIRFFGVVWYNNSTLQGLFLLLYVCKIQQNNKLTTVSETANYNYLWNT